MAKRKPPPRRKRKPPSRLADQLVELANQGRFDKVLARCQQESKRGPLSATSLHVYGVAQTQLGQSDAAIETLKRAVETSGAAADPRQTLAIAGDLAKAYFCANRFDDAAKVLQALLQQNPERIELARNLVLALENAGRLEEATERCGDLVQRFPADAQLAFQYGDLLMAAEDWQSATDALGNCLKLDPDHEAARRRLVSAYRSLGDNARVTETLKDWLKHDPNNPVADHLLSAQEFQDSPLAPLPQQASNEYVRQVFDQFADTFDEELETLGYCVPQIIAATLRELELTADRQLSMLDAGCGTGLMAAHLRPYCARLVGVDLSSEMLKRAARRGYDEIVCGDLVAYLDDHTHSFDLIVAADTLIYFGDLTAALAAAFAALRAKGSHLIFSLESFRAAGAVGGVGSGYHLNPSGRYSHEPSYVRETLREAGFTEIEMREHPIRNEAGKEVMGEIWLARCG